MSSKLMEMNCSARTPISSNSCFTSSSITDFPLRRMPVITLTNSPLIKGRIRRI